MRAVVLAYARAWPIHLGPPELTGSQQQDSQNVHKPTDQNAERDAGGKEFGLHAMHKPEASADDHRWRLYLHYRRLHVHTHQVPYEFASTTIRSALRAGLVGMLPGRRTQANFGDAREERLALPRCARLPSTPAALLASHSSEPAV